MINETFLTKQYYLDHMSMFFKNSYGIIDREEILRSILLNVNNVGKEIINSFDIFNEKYFEITGLDPNSTVGQPLDFIASMYGITRSLKVNYSYYDSDTGTFVNRTDTIVLTNFELVFYLKVFITKINYQGTYEEIKNLYEPYGITYTYNITGIDSLECKVECTLNDGSGNNIYGTVSSPTNLGKLILSDNLLIESIGIVYKKSLGSTSVAEFDNSIFDSSNTLFGA